MFTLLFLAMLSVLLFTSAQSTRSQMDRMTLAFGVANSPYPKLPKPKGKGTKDKFMHLMARAKYAGTGVIGLSGKIAGTVFLSNNVVRVWRKPNNVRNALTQLVRGVFSGTSTAWKTLTGTEINSWITAAPLYFSKKVFATAYALKGNTLFQKVNNYLVSLGLTAVTTAPGVAVPQMTLLAAIPSAAAGAATFTVSIDDFQLNVAVPAHTFLKVYATRQRDIGKSSFAASDYRYIGFYPPTTSIVPLDIKAEYVARFGALAVGQRIGVVLEVVSYDPTVTPGVFGASGKLYTSCVVAA